LLSSDQARALSAGYDLLESRMVTNRDGGVDSKGEDRPLRCSNVIRVTLQP